MKLIAIEEHFLTSEIRKYWKDFADVDPIHTLDFGHTDVLLDEVGTERLRLMDETGVDVQVLSLTTPGVHNLKEHSVELSKQTNDWLATIIASKPERFQGFATLPTPVPKLAAPELERAVNKLGFKGAMLCGRTSAKNLDHKDYWPIFECASALHVPLFIHPQIPQQSVRDTYYSGFNEQVDFVFSTFGLGWHYEAGIQFMRMMLAGVFDEFPELQVILGHWGEVVLFYTERYGSLNRMAKLKRPIVEYMKQNLYVTPSGMYSNEYMRRSIDIIGADRILFSTDYPYQYRPGTEAKKFMEQSPLNEVDKVKFAHSNWERLTGSIKNK
ncbi:MAG: amidohydrolase family protein [Bacteroidia bacterium]